MKRLKKKHIAGGVITVSLLTGTLALFNSTNIFDFESAPTDVAAQAPDVKQVFVDSLTIQKDPDVVYNREDILNDYENRVSESFKIPDNLRDRVGFWFDIYTQHNSNKRLIHHSLYPWIVFEVVDVTPIIEADLPKHRWMRNLKADEFVKQEVEKAKTALKSLSKRKHFESLTPDEAMIADALNKLDGDNLAKKAKVALQNIRVQTGQKDHFHEGLEVSPQYLPGMEEIFQQAKLPVELTRIPFVESSFNKHAQSKVGASGIWQFMGGTGRKFMIVDQHIDERNSPFKASVAAAQLLKENHMILKKSWPLAITAWNHGPPGMRKAMAAAKSHDLGEIVGKYRSRSFDFASSNFYSEFLAALFAERYHTQIFKDLQYEDTLDLHTVKLARSIGAKELVRLSGLSNENFLHFNPDLKKAIDANMSVPSGFTLMLDNGARAVLKNLIAKETPSKKRKLSKNDISLSSPIARE
ncbi:MAG: transglycosylase SLT domain-containing protein [Bdellovibrio sp.]|nr:transglycosylase SLT domain-containing protein [Bdellovibrio sp.]